MAGGDGFLSRWSRRKAGAKSGAPVAEAPAKSAPPAGDAPLPRVPAVAEASPTVTTVSYTHLTLPTILRV